MLENVTFCFSTKRVKITRLSTLLVGGGENLLVVPKILSGIVTVPFISLSLTLEGKGAPHEMALLRVLLSPRIISFLEQ